LYVGHERGKQLRVRATCRHMRNRVSEEMWPARRTHRCAAHGDEGHGEIDLTVHN
jgi:hypothetical protein